MADSYVIYTAAGGEDTYAVPFLFLKRSHVAVTKDDVAATDYTWLSDSLIKFNADVTAAVVIKFQRVTPTSPAFNSNDGVVLTDTQIKVLARQAIYLAQETADAADDTLALAQAAIDSTAGSEAAAAVSAADAAVSAAAAVVSAAAAAASATGASASQVASAASAAAAAASQVAAAASAAAAAASQSAAATSATSASSSATSAAASASAAAASASAASASQTAAASSATAASASASAASSSASAAATSATAAASSATAASSSETAAAASAATLYATSTTSLTPAVASKVFTTQAGKSFGIGAFVQIASAATPAVWMFGQVTAYSGTTLTVDALVIGTASAAADWNIWLAGSRGAAGATGSAGASGTIPIAAAAGTVDAITADFTPDLTLTDKVMCSVVSAGANTSATPTFSPDGLTARTIKTRGGADLMPGDIGPAGYVMLLEYNLANTRWELMNPVYAKGSVIQEAFYETGAYASCTTNVPCDDSKPQNTEGDQVMTLSITPKHASNKLEVDVVVVLTADNGGNAVVSLYQDSIADAIKSGWGHCVGAGISKVVPLMHAMAAGGTSSIAFKVRAGISSGTLYFNGYSGARYYGGVLNSCIRIREIVQ